ncbi:glycosyltransferase family 9 protein [soil metagenome]
MKILIIQTAFIGDVILATPLLRVLADTYPDVELDVLIRKGNESLLKNFPGIRQILIWDKTQHKNGNLLTLLGQIRNGHYDHVINLQRFAATGLLTAFSNGKQKIGFDKNPFSFLFDKKISHQINKNLTNHEVERNFRLIAHLTSITYQRPILYPDAADYAKISVYQQQKYVTLAPASVWFTKQLPQEKWITLIHEIRKTNGDALTIFLNGGPGDQAFCESIRLLSKDNAVVNLAGKLSLLQTAALMKDAVRNFVNDSAPLHLASAMNAPVTVFFCSTVPAFGFGPLSDIQQIIETDLELDCRPCGLHGFKTCPKGHFKCGFGIDVKKAVDQYL